MAVAVTFHLTGDKRLDELFKTLTPRVQKKVLRKPLRDAVKTIHPAVQALTPVRSGKLRRSIKVRAGKRSRRHKDEVRVILATGQRLFGGEFFYGAFVEFGHKVGSRKKISRTLTLRGWQKVDPRKKVPGRQFMKLGMRAREASAKQVALTGIAQGIEREAASGATT